MAKQYPTAKQLRALAKSGWTKFNNGLFWQSPPDDNGKSVYYAPRGAVAHQKLRQKKNG